MWHEGVKQWVRNKNIFADELHKRRADEYKKAKKGQSDEHPWRYTGVCYADHLSGE